MRGENASHPDAVVEVEGSSPHARGKHLARAYEHLVGGLIPACAGKTEIRIRPHEALEAHPRMRGENVRARRMRMGAGGSSPHARGKHTSVRQGSVSGGLIPACAGKTRVVSPPLVHGWAHPRMRGENSVCLRELPSMPGSSPHARGKPIQATANLGH